jgi:hypothetical protein
VIEERRGKVLVLDFVLKHVGRLCIYEDHCLDASSA